MPQYEVLRKIAERVNSTNQRIGQLLEDYGYRYKHGKPTELAHQQGWVSPYRLDCGNTSWKWNVEKVLEFLRTLESRHPGIITPKKIPQKRKKR